MRLRLLSIWVGLAMVAAGQETTAIPASSSAENAEVFRDLVIPAGKVLLLESAIDYSLASSVAITLACTTCTSSATALGSGLVLQARWLVPNADLYVPTEQKAGSTFPFLDAGNAVFAVFGSKFRLALQNKGSQGLLIQQVTLFRRVVGPG